MSNVDGEIKWHAYMREIKVRIHARMSRKKVRSGHLSPWIFLVFIDTLLILVWTYTVSLGKILFFGDFNAGKDWKNTLCIFQDQEGFFLLSKDFFATSMAFPPFFSWPLLTRSRRKKVGFTHFRYVLGEVLFSFFVASLFVWTQGCFVL